MSNQDKASGKGPDGKGGKSPEPPKPGRGTPVNPAAAAPEEAGRFFRPVDWVTFGASTLIILLAYLWTLAPDLTLEDCGELAVGSFYAGVPHAPGYPVWTVYSWLFTVLLPFSNIAWRVAVSSAVAAALASGMLGMMVSRGSTMILEGIPEFKQLERRWEQVFCVIAGIVAACMLGFNGFMWSQAIIVEVYTLSVFSFMGVLCALMRWMYRPEQKRYLYLAFLLYGISFNNHQTLIVAAMGLEVAIIAAHPRLGRDILLGNTVVYLAGLVLKSAGILTSFDNNTMLYFIYNAVGLGSLAGCVWLCTLTKGLLSEWKAVLWLLLAWVVGAATVFYMPITSATNPPMNWGYPRTWSGFVHAFTRGQYERTNPTNIFSDPFRFLEQLRMYFEGAVEEFHLVFLLLAIIPFLFVLRMQKRERAWIIGNTSIYLCLAFLLLVLLNPTVDRQSKDLTKVFFTASHVTIAMFLGYGLTLIAAALVLCYRQYRTWALYGSAVAVAVAVYHLASKVNEVYADPKAGLEGARLFFHGIREALANTYFTAPVYSIYAGLLVLLLILFFLGIILLCRDQVKPGLLAAAFALIPVFPMVSHWAENEQRGHMFGFWFGHDMFTPPYELYPEMTHNAILFGGTDPGRFCPTYMIFCESFIKAKDRFDPKFDRRDVYIITQNALADGTYLDYIRAHYNRSAQSDPPFLQDFTLWLQSQALGKDELTKKMQGQFHRTNKTARVIGSMTNIVAPFDRVVTDFGKRVEDRRRREGVYPPKEILTPSVEDSQKCFQEYITDAQRRLLHDTQFPNEAKQIKPGELVSFTPDGRVQVSGQVAVMAINGLLTKIIFDKNPTNEFFVEESFPLDWMYPYLSPYGIIMKLNRQPVPEFTEDMLRRDHDFWTRFSERLCGNWIKYETPIQEICAFVDKVYTRGNLAGYKGDIKFVRDNDAQKAFSKLRNSIAGLYAWRINEVKNVDERNRLIREADFAFKQAFAFCPFSPETVSRYVTLLVGLNRLDDALAIAETCQRLDPESGFTRSLIDQITRMKQGMTAATQVQSQVTDLERQYQTNPENIQVAFTLASAYLQLQRTAAAYQILEKVAARTNADAGVLLSVANAFVQLNQYQRAEPALRRLVTLVPNQAEIWYDLAGAQTILGKPTEALQSLRECLRLNELRLRSDPKASNLLQLAAGDPRFVSLRPLPEFQKLVGQAEAPK
jgi:tetratricopeptide (TPR) repeat protein